MVLKIISYIAGIFAIISGGIYLYVYDQMTREPLKILWVNSSATTDLRNILDEFTDATNIAVLVEGVPRELYRETVDREMTRKTRSFDVVIGDMTWLASDVSRGWYENITPLVRTGWLVKNPGDLIYENTPKGSSDYYAVPVALDALSVVFSKSVLEREENKTAFRLKYSRDLELPKTFSELVDIAIFFAEYEEGRYRAALPSIVENSFASTLFFSTLMSNNGSLFNSYTMLSDGSINTKLAVGTLEQLRAIVQASVTSSNVESDEEHVFVLNSFDRLQSLRKSNRDLVFVAFPQITDKKSSFIVQYVASIVSDTTHKRAASKFISWWQSREAQELWREQRGFAEDDAGRSDEYSYMNAYTEATHDGIQFIHVSNNSLIREMSQNYIGSYLIGDTDFTAQETLDTIAKAWDKMVSE